MPVAAPTPSPSRPQPAPGPGEAAAHPAADERSPNKKAPKSQAPRRKADGAAGVEPGAKPRAPRRKTQKMGQSSAPPPASGPGAAAGGAEGPDLTVYQITLVPGPEILRRGNNPLGVLDELRDLGEATIITDAALVPPLDLIDPECCYLSWTITLKTGAGPDRIDDAFLFFAEDSIVTIERWTPDGKLVPVRPSESTAAATATVNGLGGSAAPSAEPSIPTVSHPVVSAAAGSPSPINGNGTASAHPGDTGSGPHPVPPTRPCVGAARDCATARPHSRRRRATR